MYEYLDKLNAEQREVATTIDGYMMVFAGAGSGKTCTLINRVAYMLDNGINPENILLLTFTNKAAKEMRDRAVAMVGERAELITACTFHSFCANILRKNSHLLGLNPGFTIIDSPDMMDAMSIAIETFLSSAKEKGEEYDLKDFPSKKDIAKVYETVVNDMVYLDEVIEQEDSLMVYADEIRAVLKNFIQYKRDRDLLDYDDLLYYTDKLLTENKDFRKVIGAKYSYICADEYQDTNVIQNHILELLAEEKGNLTVVGDDNQSIYKFRFAKIENILDFTKIHPDAKQIMLTTNYRSSNQILDFVNAMMEQATEGVKKDLHGTFEGDVPKLVCVSDCYKEANYIAEKIFTRKCKLSEMAVLCRGAAQTYILENLLNSLGIPYNKYGGLKFMEKKVIKDLLAYLRATVNKADELAWFRILQLYPGIGQTYAQRISEMIAMEGFETAIKVYKKKSFCIYIQEIEETVSKLKTMNLKEQFGFLINDYYENTVRRSIMCRSISAEKKSEAYKTLDDSKEDMNALQSMAEKYRTASAFLADIVLTATEEEKDDDKLNISTIHSAKGLEYHTVFVMDCIEKVTPRCEESSPENPEELRCMYVACTRAKHELYLMAPRFYNMSNSVSQLTHFLRYDNIFEKIQKEYI